MLQAGAIIAKEHHERYDGKGYPASLQGEEIHIFARITAIADVFDALDCEQVYKKTWSMDEIVTYFYENRGGQFEPLLVDLVFSNFDEILKIKEKFTNCC